ncbi:MAG: hypothetical protein HC770_13530 [Pseudanabaena sp. CRU_2_10]|nr:hypothetical protein [Pseudanabaena sp. CRU_2_10]
MYSPFSRDRQRLHELSSAIAAALTQVPQKDLHLRPSARQLFMGYLNESLADRVNALSILQVDVLGRLEALTEFMRVRRLPLQQEWFWRTPLFP